MSVNTRLFEAYLECPTKCWLRSRLEPTTGNVYAEWAREQSAGYAEMGCGRLRATVPESDCAVAPRVDRNFFAGRWHLAVDLRLWTTDLESHLWAIEKTTLERQVRRAHFIPYRFEFPNKVTKNHKLTLAFDALVFSEMTGRLVTVGRIMHGDGHAILTVKLASLVRHVQKLIKPIAALLANESPPNLELNRHCAQCEFQRRCRQRALEKDDLSLLSGMRENERRQLCNKGIFTTTQLSYTFRPRRRRRRLSSKREKFHHSLRALAIRENKIHAVDLEELKLKGTLVYLDVEGLPDRNFYYLIGVRVGTGPGAVQYGLWANDVRAEAQIWHEFLDVLSTIPDPQLVYYGSYEKIFLNRMRNRYGGPNEGSAAAIAIDQALNLLSFLFARVYFPTFSNGLKDIARYFGFRWQGSPVTGLEAIVWRHQWERSMDFAAKQALLDYNRQDCEALELVASKLVELSRAVPSPDASPKENVVHTSEIKRENPYRFGRVAFALPEMEAINKAAYWNYQRQRVYLKSGGTFLRYRLPTPTRLAKPRPNATIDHQTASHCPTCGSVKIYSHGTSSKTIIDLRFMTNGIKRWVVRYLIHRQRCQLCKKIFKSSDLRWTPAKYGWNLISYAMYQNIELRLPQTSIDSSMSKLFGLCLPRGWTNKMKMTAAQSYAITYDRLLAKLCSGRLLHIDETSISVKGVTCYVWVLTSMDEVAYFFTPTREGNAIQLLLKNFSGVLVSDFYTAYDAIECPQQKCLIHFIRELNNAILDHPYDEALKKLAANFAALVKPIIETVDRRGLKKRFLKKFWRPVQRFYKQLVIDSVSEAEPKLVARLQKYRNKMFTFLDFDGVPWNNNNAEHAVKAFALLRPVIEGHTTERGIRDTLVLLSICETCKSKNVGFLDFLRSGSKDIDDFSNAQRGRKLASGRRKTAN
jgi:predicted RecB family nuclease